MAEPRSPGEGAPAKPNRPALALHVPEPKYRPGDKVDFSHLSRYRRRARSRALTKACTPARSTIWPSG
ncbi:MAG: hypothetical protein KatS3mg120_0228 [Erythrobacter sp.]|nr:MAG: hypothetical protein KatS3mg120_0228 [Erythrobacter sp.]